MTQPPRDASGSAHLTQRLALMARKPKPTPLVDADTIIIVQAWIRERSGQWSIPEAIALLIRRGIDAPAAQALPSPVFKRHPVGVRATLGG
jgi:hypothetical protein